MKRFAAVLFLVACVGGATEAYATETPPLTVSAEGVANVPIPQAASQTEANAAYRAGLTAAIADGYEKAEFLAAGTGAKLGPIDQIVERGGSISCELPAEEGPLSEYQQYKGARPDIGSVEPGGAVYAPAPAAAPPRVASKPGKKKHKHKAKAKKAVAVSCTLSTQVVLSYALVSG